VQALAFVADQVSVALPPLDTLPALALRLTAGAAGLATDTVTDWAADPPAPVQVNVYFVVAVTAAVPADPLVPSLPFQPPEALHEVALLDDQVKVALPPLLTVEGFALNVTVGVAFATATVADCEAVPPLPWQVSMYVCWAVRLPVACVPLVDWLPDQPPEAVHELALVADHDKVEALPLITVLGLALSETVGAAELTLTVADCVALPPAPVQSSEYVVFALRAPVACDPLVG
jgi:hypothetical protein